MGLVVEGIVLGLAALGIGVAAQRSGALPRPSPEPSWPQPDYPKPAGRPSGETAANDPDGGKPPKKPKLEPPLVPFLLTLLVANALFARYLDKSKLTEECKKVLQKYRVHQYKDRTKFTEKGTEASHHALQNAHLEFPRGKGGLQDICPGYKEGDGVSIPLDDAPGGVHDKVGDMQTAEANKHRRNGTRPTYQDAREATKNQMKDGVGMSPEEAECVAQFIDEKMREICPDLVNKNLHVRTW